jgi:CBS domain-containing membrane protein
MTEMLHRPLWEDDGILADRVRSELGPVLKRLDQPRVHVMAAQGIVSLHGDVSDTPAKAAIEAAVRRVSGVASVRSHLHVGLQPGEMTPSEGHLHERSPLLRRLEQAVRMCGYLTDAEARYVLRAVLGVFSARLPDPQRRRFLEHLPDDVRRLALPAHWLTSDVRAISSEHDLAQTVAVAMRDDRPHADRLLRHVLPIVRDHAPEDADTIAQSLSAELRAVWLEEPASAEPVSPQSLRREAHRDAASLLDLPVSAVMSRNVVRAAPQASLFEAFELMARAHVHHLPVVRPDGHCVALIDAVSVAQRLPEAWVTRGGVALHQLGEVGPLSVLPDVPLVKVAAGMDAAGVDACCVVDVHGRLIGLVTARDLIAALARAADGA